MKCAPLTADSENNTPLLATIPTGIPYSRANPVTKVVPMSEKFQDERISNKEAEPASDTKITIKRGSTQATRTIHRLELVETRPVDQTSDDLAYIERLTQIR